MSVSTPNQVSPVLSVLPVLHTILPLRNIHLSFPQKVTVVSITVGLALIGVLARYLRRRSRKVTNPDNSRRFVKRGIVTAVGPKSPNGDVLNSNTGRRSASPGGRSLHRQSSVLSVASGWLASGTPAGSVVGGAVGPGGDATARLTPQQLGLMGIEALDTAVNYWEDALASYEYRGPDSDFPLAVTSAEEAEFSREIQCLLDAAYELQNQSELLFLDQRSVLFRTESSFRHGDTVITSSPESFVSAQDESPQQNPNTVMASSPGEIVDAAGDKRSLLPKLETKITFGANSRSSTILTASKARSQPDKALNCATSTKKAPSSCVVVEKTDDSSSTDGWSPNCSLLKRKKFKREPSKARRLVPWATFRYRSKSSSRESKSSSHSSENVYQKRPVVDLAKVADLREFEEFAEVMPDFDTLFLYQAAQRHYEESGVPYRVLRTEMVHCSSDVEYLCKTHCVRLGFQYLFLQETTYQWFADAGRQMLTDMILFADKDPKDFLIAYEEMMDYVADKTNWSVLEQELHLRGVKALTFYDVVMDYFLMDSFDDLEAPPSSVTAVVQNRWLSNGFKETALATAVWSVLKAKRRMLKFPEGFMAHFYAISEHVSPLLAWGFLGPDENLRNSCFYFRDQVMGFLIDIFSFHKTRYTCIEELSADMLAHLKTRLENISQRLQS